MKAELTLLSIAVVGFVALAVASDGSLLSGSAVETLFAYVAVPILIGVAQLVALAVGQMNLSVGALGGFVAVTGGIVMADNG
ncbi:hypothetical protein ACFQ1S_46995, partial [Kibdelosporangium lantanae]